MLNIIPVKSPVAVLDHGYVMRVEEWGSDEGIVEAARMSTGKGFLGWYPGNCPVCDGDGVGDLGDGERSCVACEGKGKIPGDAKLLRTLKENNHDTPFEMAGLTIEIQAPIFIFREWHRHRTQSYNEMSARYVPLPDLNYIPSVERVMLNSKTNKQAGLVKGAEEMTEPRAREYRFKLAAMYDADEVFYQESLMMGVPKELARVHLPVGRYSKMRASANLRNWLAFLTLRDHAAAQFEIQQFAGVVHDIVAQQFPRTMELFEEGRKFRGRLEALRKVGRNVLTDDALFARLLDAAAAMEIERLAAVPA